MKKLLLTLTLVAPAAITQAKKIDRDFLKAVAEGNLKKAQVALEYGAYVNMSDNQGYTALHHAIIGKPFSWENTNPHLLKLLLDKGADVDEVADNSGYGTVLQCAAQKGDALATYLLRAYGAKDTPTGSSWTEKETARDYALQNGYDDINALLILCSQFNREYSDTRDTYGPEAYSSVSPEDFCKALEYVIDDFFCYNIDLSLPNPWGVTLLHYTVKIGNIEATQRLLNYSADTQVKTIHGFTPLHIAAQEDHVEIAELLLTTGADINALTDTGETPLSIAKEKGHTELIKLLEEHISKK